ncbi:MAG TPA: AI-2E family transporter [Candidatus Eisenbacteria bacterium]|nr:AI-2E family transporter [Candidatus Eisenbacteria bacterium]
MEDSAPSAPRPDSRTPRRLIPLLWVVVIAILIAFGFFASSLCITFLLAGFLAILCDPIPTLFERWRIPRALSSAILVFCGIVLFSLVVRASYGRVSAFIDDIPEYADRIHEALAPLWQNIEKVQKTAGTLNADSTPRKRIPEVRINDSPTWPSYLIRGVGSVWGALIVAGVVPFLMFFMLSRKMHLYNWLEGALGNYMNVPLFTSRLGHMVRGFAVGNLIIGAAMAAATVGVLLALKVQGAVLLGIASGFLNLIPFLGVILAAIVPMMPALAQFDNFAPLVIIFVAVVTLHFISANLLIPKFIGSRVNIGPVAATVGLLFWGWLWGIMGILLAVPLTAFVKLISDCHPSLIHISNLLAETPRSPRPWPQPSSPPVTPAVPLLGDAAQSDAKD